MELSTIKTQTTWAAAAETINSNNNKIAVAIQSAIVNSTNSKHKGYFSSSSVLPSGEEGAIAFVGEWPNYNVYYWSNGSWYNSGQEAYLEDYVSSSGNPAIVGSLTVTEGVRSYKFIVAKNANEDYGDGYVILAGGGVKDVNDFVSKSGSSAQQITTPVFIRNEFATKKIEVLSGNEMPTGEVPEGSIYAQRFIVKGGTSSQILLGNGTTASLDELSKLKAVDTADAEDYDDVF